MKGAVLIVFFKLWIQGVCRKGESIETYVIFSNKTRYVGIAN